jgi:WD40 repeat protein
LLRAFARQSSMAGSLACSDDDRTVFAGTHNGTIEVWNLETGNMDRVLVESGVVTSSGSSDETVDALTFSNRGQLLVAGHRGGWLRLWDTQNWTVRRLSAHTGTIACVVFSRDYRYLATASHDNTARIWRTRTWESERVLAWHGSCVSAVAFSPNCEIIATGSFDNTVGIWELRFGRLCRVLTGHTAWVTDVAYLPDGVRVASASYDGTLRLWNILTGRCTAILKGHTGAVTSMSLVGDGARLISASVDGTVRLWDVNSATELATFWAVRGGGATTAGAYALLSDPSDIELFHVRTGGVCAPLALYTDLCLKPERVADAVSGRSAPRLALALDVVQRAL